MDDSGKRNRKLRRELGLWGAVFMGLGSIVGTGVFVSTGIAAGSAGPLVIVAIILAALVAACNGFSSAQLAAAHPVSGGTYEYGYRWLGAKAGFTAGWMFLCAKSASAATAALGFAGYALSAFGAGNELRVPLALIVTVAVTVLILGGMRRTSRYNTVVVSLALAALVFFVLAGLPSAGRNAGANLVFASGGGGTSLPGFLEAVALMFVAYTGYGRIATLSEEVREPRRVIPRAIIVTLLVTMLLYVTVTAVAVAAAGASRFASYTSGEAAPLEMVAREFGVTGAGEILAVGAVAAMAGVLLNLILGLSRVWLAMGRRKDMPPLLAGLKGRSAQPVAAVVLTCGVICALVLIGDVKTTWSFSAFTVLVYYALTNLSALKLTPEQRLFPRWVSWAGLFCCLFLAFWVKTSVMVAGLALIVFGLLWQRVAVKLQRQDIP